MKYSKIKHKIQAVLNSKNVKLLINKYEKTCTSPAKICSKMGARPKNINKKPDPEIS